MVATMDNLLTTSEVQELLKLDRTTIYRMLTWLCYAGWRLARGADGADVRSRHANEALALLKFEPQAVADTAPFETTAESAPGDVPASPAFEEGAGSGDDAGARPGI